MPGMRIIVAVEELRSTSRCLGIPWPVAAALHHPTAWSRVRSTPYPIFYFRKVRAHLALA